MSNENRNIISKMEHELQSVAESHITDIIDAAKELTSQVSVTCDEKWVERARGDYMVKSILQYVHVKNGVMEATDGYLLLWCDSTRPDGLYDKHWEMCSGETFPDTSELAPNFNNWQEIVIGKQDDERIEINGDNVVTLEYFDTITEGAPDQWQVAFKEFSKKMMRPIRFRHKSSSRCAMLMPRLEKVEA